MTDGLGFKVDEAPRFSVSFWLFDSLDDLVAR